ncbi:MAG: DUF6933 domain-containing protein [Gemmatimonadales bacterium]
MVVVRCTQRLLKRFDRVPDDRNDTGPDSKLGNWYANVITTRPRHLALCANERTLLSVVVPVAPISGFLDRFRDAALRRIHQTPVAASLRLPDAAAFVEIQVGRTQSRSVLASMNQLRLDAQVWLENGPTGDIEELGRWLCDRPCSALRTHWPWCEAEFLLTGTMRASHVRIRPERLTR